MVFARLLAFAHLCSLSKTFEYLGLFRHHRRRCYTNNAT